MLISAAGAARAPTAQPIGPARRPAFPSRRHCDEILDVQRQRRAALRRDVGVESGRLGDAQQLDAGVAAMGHGELIDDRDAEAGLDQRADRGAEPRPDGDVVAEVLRAKISAMIRP